MVLRARITHINKSAQHFPTLKIDFYFLYTECGGLVCLFARHHTPTSTRILIYRCWAVKYVNWVGKR